MHKDLLGMSGRVVRTGSKLIAQLRGLKDQSRHKLYNKTNRKAGLVDHAITGKWCAFGMAGV